MKETRRNFKHEGALGGQSKTSPIIENFVVINYELRVAVSSGPWPLKESAIVSSEQACTQGQFLIS